MATFRCTAKILKELGVKPSDSPAPHVDDWHVNLIRYGPKKLVLFCSTETLFSCVTPPVSRAEIKNIESIFLPALEIAMAREGFSNESIQFCKAKYKNMGIAKTNSKSVLGTMTDYLYHIDAHLYDFGRIEGFDFGNLSFRLNQIPHVNRDFFNASDAFKKTLIRGVA